jgi:biopolymer transport protein ExbD
MTDTRPREADSLTGLRTRYSPRGRINPGLASIGPWVDAVLLVLMFVLFDRTYALRPGVLVDFPEAPFADGSHASIMAVVLPVSGADGSMGEIVFFDDERFRVDADEDMSKLRGAFADRAREHPGEALVVQADVRVRHGTVMRLVDMASQVGIKQVNMAHKAPQ